MLLPVRSDAPRLCGQLFDKGAWGAMASRAPFSLSPRCIGGTHTSKL